MDYRIHLWVGFGYERFSCAKYEKPSAVDYSLIGRSTQSAPMQQCNIVSFHQSNIAGLRHCSNAPAALLHWCIMYNMSTKCCTDALCVICMWSAALMHWCIMYNMSTKCCTDALHVQLMRMFELLHCCTACVTRARSKKGAKSASILAVVWSKIDGSQFFVFRTRASLRTWS